MSKIIPQPIFDTLEQLRMGDNPKVAYAYPLDYQQGHAFLFSYRGSEATFNAYRREIERLFTWSWFIEKKSIRTLSRQNIEQFIEFCQNPPEHWIGDKQVARFKEKEGLRIANPDWRPFVVMPPKTKEDYRLSPKTVQAIFSILGSFYQYLIQEDYCEYNPVAQIRQKSKFIRKIQGHAPIRRLSELQWSYVLEASNKNERTLFMMNALYGMYLRISELAASPRWQPQMGDFQRDMDGNWWFNTVGKGNKSRQISVSDAMLAALKRYRQSLGLAPTPSPGETTPLISKAQGRGPITSTRQIRSIVQTCFDEAIAKMEADGLPEEAEQLKSATVHWLRHTGISEDVKYRPREHVRDDAGHGSSAITDRYIDVELRERHASKRKHKINPDD